MGIMLEKGYKFAQNAVFFCLLRFRIQLHGHSICSKQSRPVPRFSYFVGQCLVCLFGDEIDSQCSCDDKKQRMQPIFFLKKLIFTHGNNEIINWFGQPILRR